MIITTNRVYHFWKNVDINIELKNNILIYHKHPLVTPLLLKFIQQNNEYHFLKDKCWDWKGTTDKDGYGKVFSMTAHRFSWMISRNNENIKGNIIMHTCDRPPCVNPFHLKKGTYQQNSDDMVRKGRSLFGEKHLDAILKETDIPVILQRLYNGDILVDVAFDYNITEASIYEIYKRKSWKHITKDYDPLIFIQIEKNLKKNMKRNKLSEEQVKEIRSLFKQGHRKSNIAKIYGVGPTTITNILDGTFWSYLK